MHPQRLNTAVAKTLTPREAWRGFRSFRSPQPPASPGTQSHGGTESSRRPLPRSSPRESVHRPSRRWKARGSAAPCRRTSMLLISTTTALRIRKAQTSIAPGSMTAAAGLCSREMRRRCRSRLVPTTRSTTTGGTGRSWTRERRRADPQEQSLRLARIVPAAADSCPPPPPSPLAEPMFVSIHCAPARAAALPHSPRCAMTCGSAGSYGHWALIPTLARSNSSPRIASTTETCRCR